MNEITITVKGQVGTGKSTIAQLITKALKNEGLQNFKLNDEGTPSMAFFQARTKSLRHKNTVITINVEQDKRTINMNTTEKAFTCSQSQDFSTIELNGKFYLEMTNNSEPTETLDKIKYITELLNKDNKATKANELPEPPQPPPARVIKEGVRILQD